MHGPVFGEFFGTLIPMPLGDGVVANVLLKKSKGENDGWMVITTAGGLAVLFGIVTSLAVGAVAHLNPVITIALAVSNGAYTTILPYVAAKGGSDWSYAPVPILAPVAGGVVGARICLALGIL